MRVIAGILGGRQFKSPSGHRTHPMSEKARGALFNTLGRLDGLTVLDAFSGSGAIGFEAISRGASSVVSVEKSVRAYRTIKENITNLGLEDELKATRANVSGWSDNNPEMQFDVVIADPPFDKIQPKVLDKLTRHVKEGGTLVLSWPGSEKPPELKSLKAVKSNDYGDNQLIFYTK